MKIDSDLDLYKYDNADIYNYIYDLQQQLEKKQSVIDDLKEQNEKLEEKISKSIGCINCCCGLDGMSKDEIRCLKEMLGDVEE